MTQSGYMAPVWKCVGCGHHTPDQIRACDCLTSVLSRPAAEGLRFEYSTKFEHAAHARWPHLSPREADAAAGLEMIVKGRPGWRHAAEIALAALNAFQPEAAEALSRLSGGGLGASVAESAGEGPDGPFAGEASCQSEGFACAARSNPEDCGWPFCGCDPAADRVLESIQEHYMAIVPLGSKLKEDVHQILAETCRGELHAATAAIIDRIAEGRSPPPSSSGRGAKTDGGGA